MQVFNSTDLADMAVLTYHSLKNNKRIGSYFVRHLSQLKNPFQVLNQALTTEHACRQWTGTWQNARRRRTGHASRDLRFFALHNLIDKRSFVKPITVLTQISRITIS